MIGNIDAEVRRILTALEPLRARGFWLAEQSEAHVKLVRVSGPYADALLLEWDPRPGGWAVAVRVAKDDATADPMMARRPLWERRGPITDVVAAALTLP